jgi:hypothetical protein
VNAEPVSVPQLRPLGIGEILDVAIKIFWRYKGTLIRIVLLVSAPVAVLTNLIEFSALPNRNAFGSNTSTTSSHDATIAITGGLLALLLGWLATSFATAACFKAIGEAYVGHTPSWKESLRFVGRRLPSVIWVLFLGGLLTVFGFVLCIVPGVYLAVAFSVATPALLLEGVRGRRALGRSRNLVRGRWWAALALLAIGAILTSIVSGVLTGLVSTVTLTDTGKQTVVAFILTTIAAIVTAVLTTPFKAAYTTVLYFDLRVRKEAFDLQLLAQQIGVDPPGGIGPALPPEPPPAGTQPPFWPPPPGWKPTPSDAE